MGIAGLLRFSVRVREFWQLRLVRGLDGLWARVRLIIAVARDSLGSACCMREHVFFDFHVPISAL